jgi:hypothetical protein
MIPYELLQDLNKLVCTSKNKKVEELFLKLAQEAQGGFYEWLLKISTSKKGRAKNPVYGKLIRSDIVSDLVTIYFDRENLAKNYNAILITSLQGKTKYSKMGLFTKLAELKEVSKKPGFETILKPLQSVINLATVGKNENIPNATIATWEIDLNTLWDAYKEDTKPKSEYVGRREFDRLRKEYGLVDKHRYPEGALDFLEDLDPEDPQSVSEARRQLSRLKNRTHSTPEQKKYIRDLFQFFLYNFTEEIKRGLDHFNEPKFRELRQKIESGRLPYPTEIGASMPLLPRVNDKALDAIVKAYNNIYSFKKKKNIPQLFNQTRRDLAQALNVQFDIGSGTETPKSTKDLLDPSLFLRDRGDVSDEDIDSHISDIKHQMHQQENQEENQELGGVSYMSPVGAAQIHYIMAVSMLMSKIANLYLQYNVGE